ncbi:MAG: efflux RND transporter permease subunit [Bacteroidetes bacterium]|nr:efflux RND transporter permease subunit [Bacteroidota bacterium]
MSKWIRALLRFSVRQRNFVFGAALLMTGYGVYSFLKTPIEAFPDVTNTQIIIVSQWKGRSVEEVERFVTIPIEIAMNSLQRKLNVRSASMFGLGVTTIIFEDGVEDFFARQQVNNLLATVSLPEGADAEIQPAYGPTGEIFRYTLESDARTSRELLELQNWVVDRQLRSVPGVADIVVFGGEQKIYEIQLNPLLLARYNLSPLDVRNALANSNLNVGGNVIEKNSQAFVVRGIGLLNSIQDIEDILISSREEMPVYVRNVGKVVTTGAPRVGQAGRNQHPDVVEGIVVMRKGENPSEVLARVKAKIAEIETQVLPRDVRINPFYDREKLINLCTDTVMHNLVEGIVLVTLVVFLFMADLRTTLLVGIIIPLSLLFAFICLRFMGMSANLLSLGAVDFGIIIDGAVVMVEGLFVALDHQAHKLGMPVFNRLAKRRLIAETSERMARNIFFSKLIIITALLPIFAFEKVEGKMFAPLAWTLGFALLGALLFTLTLVPALASLLLNRNVRERKNPLVIWLQRNTMRAYTRTNRRPLLSFCVALALLASSLFAFTRMGTEFLPQLNEGALWVGAKLPMSASLTESVAMANRIRNVLQSFDEVEEVLSQTGRSNDGTDPSGYYYQQFQVNLKPESAWKRKISMDHLVEEMDARLQQFPGIEYNYSQPIIDNVQEAVAGLKANNAVKIYGPDFETLQSLALQTLQIIEPIDGVRDIGLLQNLGQPELRIELDERKMAVYGVTISDAQAVIETAVGGKSVTQLYEGERKFDVTIRYSHEFRHTEKEIGEILVPTMHSYKVPLKQVANIGFLTGPAFIYRESNQRFIGVKFSVRGRDLGSTIADAQHKVHAQVKLPKGYRMEWRGEFENMVRASGRLQQVVPVTILLIFLILFSAFGNLKDAGLVLLTLPFALIGGIYALLLTNTTFGISAGIGFIALFGICVQNGVILLSVFKQNLQARMPLEQAVFEGVASRVRPVVMTALMAAIGLIPAAISTGIGSETQRPLARVVIGGLMSATVLTLLVFPILFKWFYRKKQVTS